MKMSIAWHKTCLKNSIHLALELEKELLNLKRRRDKLDKENSFYSSQIQAAEKKNLAEFDRERFLYRGGEVK